MWAETLASFSANARTGWTTKSGIGVIDMLSTPSTQSTVATASRVGNDSQPPRLSLKPTGLTTGQVDGAWWPRSRDLSVELQGLAAALTDRLGVERESATT